MSARITTAPRVTTTPKVKAPPRWTFPPPQEHQLPNGMRLLVVDQPGQHVLSLRAALQLPVSHEPTGTEGSTLLMARTMDEGTSRHTSEELAAIAERHGIAWGAGAGERGVHLGLEVISRHLDVALELVTECLSEPTFPEAEVARLVRHRVADIAHDIADPGVRAALEFRATYYDPRDRPFTPLGGTRESVRALTAEHLRNRHALLSPAGGTVVLVGDLSTVPGAVEFVSRTLGSWTGARTQADPPGLARRSEAASRVALVSRAGLAQTELYLGRPGPDRRTPHGWGTFQTLGMLLGGSPHARIDQVLREERGYTYGIRASFRPRSVGGLTVIAGSVRADATVDAVRELLAILDTPGGDFTDAEVRESADFVALTAPGRYGTADAVADELISLASDGLPLETVTQTLDQLAGLTAAKVATAWDEIRGGPGWSMVLVGDPECADGVGELGLGPVTVLA